MNTISNNSTTETVEDKLPLLRQDISISVGGPSWTGAPTWILHDKFRNRFFRIDLLAFEMLTRWKTISPAKFASAITKELGFEINQDTVVELAEFLLKNSLTQKPADDDWVSYHKQSLAQHKNIFSKVIHSYLFFRIPITRPQNFIDYCWPIVAPLFTKSAVFVFTLLGLLGLYLVSRQWEVFVTTFLDFLTFNGFLIYAVSLFFIKVIHELGHAFMAKKYNVKVPIIGLAFVVLMPILYTDTTDATRLSNRKHRLMIDIGGISAELVLAVLCTLFWVFLPDGPMRSIAFTTATLSWILSLTVNLNPFMRFDGYYILSDILGLENLQERGFALAKWRMREVFFGFKKNAPELLPKSWRTLVIFHAWGTWLYRFFLFLGIAVLVYTFFIKVVGVVLFIIEILWFIIIPIFKEIKNWWQLRSEIVTSKRSAINGVLLILALAIFIYPWSVKVKVPSVLHYPSTAAIYAPKSGKVISHNFKNGANVSKGDVLAVLNSPDLEFKVLQNQNRISLLNARLARVNADVSDRSMITILQQELAAELKQKEGFLNQKKSLTITAPLNGVLTNVDLNITVGEWINSSFKIALIKPDERPNIVGLISETDFSRIQVGDMGKFIPNDVEYNSIPLKIIESGNISSLTLDQNYLADIFGGAVAVIDPQNTHSNSGKLQLRDAWFPLIMEIEGRENIKIDNVVTGVAVINGESKSFAVSAFRQIASVAIRELGF